MEENGHQFVKGLLCAGGNRKGSCHVRVQLPGATCLKSFQGDSGGALTVNGILAGLVSRSGSEGCAKVLFYASLHPSRFLKATLAALYLPFKLSDSPYLQFTFEDTSDGQLSQFLQ